MNLDLLQSNPRYLLLNCLSGSKAYGLDLPTSDTDYKGVFVMPKADYYGLIHAEQVNNATNDIVYYELGRFVDLLLKNNPNILELLCSPEDSVLFKNPAIERFKPEMFLSKLCCDTFGGYAMTQVKRARGLNKKILNPVERELKSVIDFCFVTEGFRTLCVREWLLKSNFNQKECGLVALNHMRDLYALFHVSQFDKGVFMRGIISGENANDVSVTPIPAGDYRPLTFLYFNKDGYSIYRKDYTEYWAWVNKRNEERYRSTLEHGKNYDAKNMMHVFRLLSMSEEIAKEKKVNVRRTDREELLKIRSGAYEYEDLMKKAEDKIGTIKSAYEHTDLPESPDGLKVNVLLSEVRESLYKGL